MKKKILGVEIDDSVYEYSEKDEVRDAQFKGKK